LSYVNCHYTKLHQKLDDMLNLEGHGKKPKWTTLETTLHTTGEPERNFEETQEEYGSDPNRVLP